MSTTAVDSSECGPRMSAPSPMSAIEPYQKELEFLIAQVWLTSEEMTLSDICWPVRGIALVHCHAVRRATDDIQESF
jgi:hypothetical protein